MRLKVLETSEQGVTASAIDINIESKQEYHQKNAVIDFVLS